MSKILLTIDDIPQKVTVPMVDYLKENGIPAIFFAVGDNLEQYPEIARYVLEKGYLIGNHSFTHPGFSMIPVEGGMAEILQTEKLLDQLYEESGVTRTHRFFRFPYIDKGGENRDYYQNFLKMRGFKKISDVMVTAPGYVNQGFDEELDVACSFDCQEYYIPAATMTIESVIERLRNGDPEMGSSITDDSTQILLLHSHDETEAIVPGYYKIILEEIKNLGGRFIQPEWK